MDAKQLSALVDEYGRARQARLDLDKQAKRAKEDEDLKAAKIIDVMQRGHMAAAGGQEIIVKLREKDRPIVKDWRELYHYIRENDYFMLLQKRLHESAIKELQEEGENIPGLGSFKTHTLTVSKVT
jgi:hypothetical protein